MKKTNLFILTSMLFSLILFSGCSLYEQPPSPSETKDVYVSSTSPLETPTPEPIPSPTQIPTISPPQPSIGNGAVYGILIDKTGKPISDTIVRLGHIVWLEEQESEEGLVMSDRYRSPQDVTDEWGRFIINDIPPNNYGIVVNDPHGGEDPYFISEIGQKKTKVITIETGTVVDLKKIMLQINQTN